ncbi:solid-state culture specific protein [Penicillium citrinum]|uniref:Solid-state culture specific protein n=1 Tax=Penicillium citrinum TaxID=5077 RepID=A0A9W9TVU5_PENCI|nr:solid-state culture specific protein [Penicillium citrinum]KAJ5242574.1 solid-state culture specific protein [Penicillium citrinum]KAK5806779.1 hypothetical protein VI817_001037 [Penicillium citrinum]
MTSEALVSLDFTLKDLYEFDSSEKACPTLVYCVNDSGSSKSTEFIYHSALQQSDVDPASPEGILRLKVTSQRYGFLSGPMPVVILAVDSINPHWDEISRDQSQIKQTFCHLEPSQRPILSFATNPSEIYLEEGGSIAVVRPLDCLSCQPHHVDRKTHYEVLSKRGLIYSGLPTAPSLVIDTLLSYDEAHNSSEIVDEAARMIKQLDTQPIPFVAKFPQSCGTGTFIVSCEDSLAQIKKILAIRLPEMLSRLSKASHSLNPCSLVLERYISGKVVAISLFVTPKGRAIFICCCKQSMNGKGSWIGASISYRKQTELSHRYREIVDKAAHFLYAKGYHGPAGIDVVTDRSGNQFIIDLNVRITGSFCLGLVTGHFTKRDLFTAVIEKGFFPYPRNIFEKAFATEIRDGQIIITGWAYEETIRMGYGVVMIGGRDNKEAGSLLERVREHAMGSSK